ncbi:hypothetical protein [Kocuria rhizophila]|uniref:hypothetical protein n=1 Tax=Kocuria rhizophila TaxID=72000 RepID=UPI001EF5D8B3|nr:hypothetical protein [Kocuria rhizophila]MCG7425244.1 hypothetical protein [Kocuria rhizophila]
MSRKTDLTAELLDAAHQNGRRLSVSRARRLVARALREPDPLAYVLTYSDTTGEHAVHRAMHQGCTR